MHSIVRFYPLALRSLAAAAALVLAGCSPDKDAIVDPHGGGANDPTFANVKSSLQTSCGTCHSASSGRPFHVGMDSAALVGSGFLNPGSPSASVLLLKPRSTSHGGGVVATFGTRDSALIAAWVGKLPNVATNTLGAARTEFAPVIDGLGDALWLQSKPLTVPIGGGWAAATTVTFRAMYDDNYVYMHLRWRDNEASYRRNPWVKNANGTWSVSPAKPRPTDGTDWAAYMAARGGASFDPEAPEYMYEDKLALIFNTYGASTVPEFETVGCATACHDPNRNGSPGTTYNGTRQDLAAKKYLMQPGQILDMWHWKLVRQHAVGKIDDQYVRYWVPVNDATASNGGRASDEGAAGYRDNPAINGRPTFKSRTMGIMPPTYSIAETDTLRMTDDEVAALPPGTFVANMLTSPLGGKRADVDARAVYDRVAKVWTMEIRRRLVTGDDKDVQFNDLTRTYKWGVAVFDNAQIEHSYSGSPLSLVFLP